MKWKFYTFLFSSISIIAISCKTASKLYEKGNYDEAVELAAKKLQKDPDDPKLLAIIQNAYRYAVNDHEGIIRDYTQSNNELKWEWIYNQYVSLQRMYDAIYKVPAVYELLKPGNYTSYLVTYSEKAAQVRYDRGIAFMQRYDKQSYRHAYREFQAALSLSPGNRDALVKKNEAFEYAVTNVIILPVQQQGGYVYSSYIVGGNNLDDQLVRSLQNNSGNEFVRFYSGWDAHRQNIRVDQELEMGVATFDIGRFTDNQSRRKVTKEIVVKEIVYRPDSIVREYAKVNAEVITTQRNIHSAATLRITIRDASGYRAWSDDISASYNWTTTFSTFRGDERALSESDKELVNRRRDFPPDENEIVRCLIEEISNNAIYRLRNYFARS